MATMTMSLYRAIEILASSDSPHRKGFRAAVNGQSMLPSIPPGTWVWIRPLQSTQDGKRKISEFRLGDLIIFPMNDCEEFVCHRVIRYNRQWIWQASERYGTYSRIPRSCVVGKVYASQRGEGENHTLNAYDRFTGLANCYRSLVIRHFRRWIRSQIAG